MRRERNDRGQVQVRQGEEDPALASPALIVFGIFLFANDCASESVDAETIASGMKTKMKLPVRVDDDTRLDYVRAITKTELGYFLTLTRMTKSQLGANSIAKQLGEAGLEGGGACGN